MSRLVTLAVLALSAWLLPASAYAETAFRWRVPEGLEGDGTRGAARSVAAAAAGRPTVIVLTTCAADARWTLDGEQVQPSAVQRCTFRLDLGDHEPHQLALEAAGERVEQDVAARDILVVSIGDSVASGEGNPDVPDLARPRWLEQRCHRSMRSGAAQAALALAGGDPHSSVTFLPLACSGATVPRGLLGPYKGIQPNSRKGDLPAQLAELARLSRSRPVDAVLVSVGANDIHFGSLVRFCIFVTPCQKRRFDPRHATGEAADSATPTAEEVHASAQRELPGRYDQLHATLQAAHVDADRVIIAEYFDPTHDERGDTCEKLLPGVSAEETEWAQQAVIAPLNAEVRNAAQRHGWRLVGGVLNAFASHGICAPESLRWVRRLKESVSRGSGLSGPLHPNSAGHLATAALISPVLANVVGADPGAAVAQTSGAPDNERGGISAWFLLAAAVAGALGALLLEYLMRHR